MAEGLTQRELDRKIKEADTKIEKYKGYIAQLNEDKKEWLAQKRKLATKATTCQENNHGHKDCCQEIDHCQENHHNPQGSNQKAAFPAGRRAGGGKEGRNRPHRFAGLYSGTEGRLKRLAMRS